ncbi:hypothetical protein DMENIID0001_056510 [Sergentomyia squamirostris]
MLRFVILLLFSTMLVHGKIFKGPCPQVDRDSVLRDGKSLEGHEYMTIALMSASEYRNHFFRNIFGQSPDCWTFAFGHDQGADEILKPTEVKIMFNRYYLKYLDEFKSNCSDIYRVYDKIYVIIDGVNLFFRSEHSLIYDKSSLPLLCSSKNTWKSPVYAAVFSQIEGFTEERWRILWACEDLPNGEHDLGIILGYNYTPNNIEYFNLSKSNKQRILETGLKHVQSIPSLQNITMEDFQLAKHNYEDQCELCDEFMCYNL